MRSTQEGFRLDSPLSGFFLISFEDDEHRGISTATTMTRPSRVRGFVPFASSLGRIILPGTGWFGFVSAVTRLLQFPLALPVLFLTGLLVSAFLGIWHIITHVAVGDNAVVGDSQNRAI